MTEINKLASKAIQMALDFGATYADFRYVDTRNQSLGYADGVPDKVEESTDSGFGIRVIANGAWGYCGSADLNEKEIKRVARKAVEIAKASSMLNPMPVELAQNGKFTESYKSNYKKDPFAIPISEKLSYLAHLDELLGKSTGIKSRDGFLDFRKLIKDFHNSEGSVIHQEIIHSGAGITATAAGQGRVRASRSYPANEGIYECKGYELLDEIEFENNIPLICDQAIALLQAPECPTKTCDIVLDGSHVGLVIHESIGHPLELDRVFGSERNFSGTSFATPDNLGKLKYGSDIINVVADPTAPFGLGGFGFDDEGVKAHKTDLIKDGVLVGYISSREIAKRVGLLSSASAVADGWGNIPLVRMTNTNLAPGNMTLEQLISGIEDGIYMQNTSSWSIDDTRQNFQFGCEIGWLIEKGKLAGMVKNPTYGSNTVSFWNSCDGIGDSSLWRIWGTPNCGKGQPGQNARTGQGASPARFRNVKVGV
jgi:TldD protein